MQHFNNLQTPLKSIQRYPRLTDQQRRFTDASWRSVVVKSLWDLWSDSSFVSAEQRLAFNDVEPFDEWEEFALFASHYFLLDASSQSRTTTSVRDNEIITTEHQNEFHRAVEGAYLIQSENSQQNAEHRRFSAVCKLEHGMFGCHGGLGDQRRLNTTSVYGLGADVGSKMSLPPNEIEPRMCHTITNLSDGHCLLVGGRTSPDRGLSDCWLGQGQGWQRIEDLPFPLYRHCAITVTSHETDDSVVIFGGRTTGGKPSDAWLLWHKSTGWVQIYAPGQTPQSRFGAAMSATGVNHGILVSLLHLLCPCRLLALRPQKTSNTSYVLHSPRWLPRNRSNADRDSLRSLAGWQVMAPSIETSGNGKSLISMLMQDFAQRTS